MGSPGKKEVRRLCKVQKETAGSVIPSWVAEVGEMGKTLQYCIMFCIMLCIGWGLGEQGKKVEVLESPTPPPYNDKKSMNVRTIEGISF